MCAVCLTQLGWCVCTAPFALVLVQPTCTVWSVHLCHLHLHLTSTAAIESIVEYTSQTPLPSRTDTSVIVPVQHVRPFIKLIRRSPKGLIELGGRNLNGILESIVVANKHTSWIHMPSLWLTLPQSSSESCEKKIIGLFLK